MKKRDKFVVASKGHCLWCLKNRGVEEDGEEKGSGRGEVSIKSLMEISRILKLDLGWIFRNIPMPSQKAKGVGNLELMVPLCGSCCVVLDGLKTVYVELENLKLNFHFYVDYLHDIVKNAEKDGKRVREFKRQLASEGVASVNVAENMRMEIIRKCNRRLKKSLPKVNIRRLPCQEPVEPDPEMPKLPLAVKGNYADIESPPPATPPPLSSSSPQPWSPPPASSSPSPSRLNNQEDSRIGGTVIEESKDLPNMEQDDEDDNDVHDMNEVVVRIPADIFETEDDDDDDRMVIDETVDSNAVSGGDEDTQIKDDPPWSPRKVIPAAQRRMLMRWRSRKTVKPLSPGKSQPVSQPIGAQRDVVSCPQCGKSVNPRGYQRHIRTHTGEKPYQCSECNRRFLDGGNMRNHILRQHRASIFADIRNESVDVTSFKAAVESILKDERLSDKNKLRPHGCIHCDRYYRSKADLKSHMILAHLTMLKQKLYLKLYSTLMPSNLQDSSMASILKSAPRTKPTKFKMRRWIRPTAPPFTSPSTSVSVGEKEKYEGNLGVADNGQDNQSPSSTNQCNAEPIVIDLEDEDDESIPTPEVERSPALYDQITINKKFKEMSRASSSVSRSLQKILPSASAGIMFSQQSPRIFTCSHCAKHFLSYHEHRVHLLTQHPYESFYKYFPPGTTSARVNSTILQILENYNEKNSKGSNSYAYVCSHCGKEHTHLLSLRIHILMAHFNELVSKIKKYSSNSEDEGNANVFHLDGIDVDPNAVKIVKLNLDGNSQDYVIVSVSEEIQQSKQEKPKQDEEEPTPCVVSTSTTSLHCNEDLSGDNSL